MNEYFAGCGLAQMKPTRSNVLALHWRSGTSSTRSDFWGIWFIHGDVLHVHVSAACPVRTTTSTTPLLQLWSVHQQRFNKGRRPFRSDTNFFFLNRKLKHMDTPILTEIDIVWPNSQPVLIYLVILLRINKTVAAIFKTKKNSCCWS